ncbi:unnamed protein product [Amoebophrya sp. A25]|nr:unnamed protein product [Amoebophrya sp. A25]|eukprot:GSA25T00019821001.1
MASRGGRYLLLPAWSGHSRQQFRRTAAAGLGAYYVYFGMVLYQKSRQNDNLADTLSEEERLKIFDQIAGKWDRIVFWDEFFNRVWWYRRRLIRSYASHGDVLEVGCGTGANLGYYQWRKRTRNSGHDDLVKQGNGSGWSSSSWSSLHQKDQYGVNSLTLLDYSESMLAEASVKVAQLPGDQEKANIRLVRGSTLDLKRMEEFDSTARKRCSESQDFASTTDADSCESDHPQHRRSSCSDPACSSLYSSRDSTCTTPRTRTTSCDTRGHQVVDAEEYTPSSSCSSEDHDISTDPPRRELQKFDTCVETFGLCSYGEPLKALREMWSILRPGGRLVLLEHGRPKEGMLGIVRYLSEISMRRNLHLFGCNANLDIQGLVKEALEGEAYSYLLMERKQFGHIYLFVIEKQGNCSSSSCQRSPC